MNPKLLFSANSWIAYKINIEFYDGRHFVWAAVAGDDLMRPVIDTVAPPSSTPMAICDGLRSDIQKGDHHSAKIQGIRAGILRGAKTNLERGLIKNKVRQEITQIVKSSQLTDFWPILYVIPYERVKKKVTRVPVGERAHPLSNEYRIKDLRTCEFDLLGFPR